MEVHLDPPPGFVGFDHQRAVGGYSRSLPHWRQQGATYAVTYRLADSLPQSAIEEIENDSLREADPDLARHRLRESYLDKGLGSCVLSRNEIREVVYDGWLYWHDARYELGCFVIMPNHVHVIVRPISESLEKTLQSRKGNSAREINQRLGRSGALWQAESYDRIIRDREYLWRCIQYIGRNPQRAGLGQSSYSLWINPQWKQLGWAFAAKD
ncbi:MAG: transposase [Verrucomicrobiota bacterium]